MKTPVIFLFLCAFPRVFTSMCGRIKQLISPRNDNTIEFENDYIFVFANEVSEKTTTELDNALEENYMTVYYSCPNKFERFRGGFGIN